jgi:hypothetical protein
MNCDLVAIVPADNGRTLYRCHVCGQEVSWRDDKIKMRCGAAAPINFREPAGPGTELRRIIAELSIKPKSGCGCKALAAKMDTWGVEGCRERRQEIAAELQTKAAKFGVADWIKAGARVATGRMVLLDWTHPFLSLVELAIERASHDPRPHGPQPNPPPA